MTSSDGYSGSSDGYSGGSEDRSPEAGETHPGRPSQPADPWWVQAGFSTLEEGLAHQEALNDAMWGSPKPKLLPADPEEWLPGEAIEGAPTQVHRDATRQVNIRLDGRDHERLTALAEDYGVATAVMARMLVRRGLLAVLEARGEN
jgi:hypothetical protein